MKKRFEKVVNIEVGIWIVCLGGGGCRGADHLDGLAIGCGTVRLEVVDVEGQFGLVEAEEPVGFVEESLHKKEC